MKYVLFLSLAVIATSVYCLNQNAEGTISIISSDTTTNDLIIKQGDTLKVLAGVTLTNKGTISNHGTLNNSGIVHNSGTINIEENAPLKSRGSDGVINNEGLIFNGGSVNNKGIIMNTASGDIFTLKGSTINNSNVISNFGEFTNYHTLINNNHALIKNYNVFFNHGPLNNKGRIINYVQYIPIPNSDLGYMTLTGTITNYDVIDNEYGGTITNNHAIITNYESIDNEYGGTITNLGTIYSYSAVVNEGTMNNNGFWVGAGLGNYDTGVFTNRGLMTVEYLENSNNFINEIGSQVYNFGEIFNLGVLANRLGASITNYGDIENGNWYEGYIYLGLINNQGEIDNLHIINNYNVLINYVTLINEPGAYIDNLLYNNNSLTTNSIIYNSGIIMNHNDYIILGTVIGNPVVQG